MTVYLFDDYIGQTIKGFDVANDELRFSHGSASAISYGQSGRSLLLTMPSGSVTLAGVAIRQISTSNVTFDDGSELRIGDGTANVRADDTAQTGLILSDGNNNSVWLYGGNDEINVTGKGSNYINGNAGSDSISTSASASGDNTLRGGDANDRLIINGQTCLPAGHCGTLLFAWAAGTPIFRRVQHRVLRLVIPMMAPI